MLKAPSEDVLESLEQGEQELIELSAGSVPNQETEKDSFDHWPRTECPKTGGIYGFFNIMAIEWEDGVAYRQAIGRVVKSAWQRLATEETELTLG